MHLPPRHHVAKPVNSAQAPTHPLQVLPKMGVTVSVIDPADIGSLEAALEQHNVRRCCCCCCCCSPCCCCCLPSPAPPLALAPALPLQ